MEKTDEMKFGSKLLSCAVSAALVVGLAPAFAAPAQAVADDGSLVAASIGAQAEGVAAMPAQDGEYLYTAKAVMESTYGSDNESEFDLTRQYNKNIKLTKTGDKMTITMLYTLQGVEMMKMAIDDVEGTVAQYGDTPFKEFTMEIGSLDQDHKLSFSYDTGARGVMTHSVYLKTTGYDEAWSGYATTKLGSKNAELLTGAAYTEDIELLKATNLSEESMANGCFEGTATVTAGNDGTVQVVAPMKPLTMGGTTVQPTDVAISVYQSPSGVGATVPATVATDQRTGATNLTFDIPDACKSSDGVFVSFAVAGMPRAQSAFLAIKYAGNEPDLDAIAQAADEGKKDQAAADAVAKMISEVQASDEQSLAAAQKAYDALTETQKQLVSEETVKALFAASTVAKPVANSPLTYTGAAQTGVAPGSGYTLSGTTSATDAGSYKAIATLKDGYTWSDGTTGDVEVAWAIEKAKVAKPAAVTGLAYTGSPLTGVKAAAGYTLAGNTATDAGAYKATATLDKNHAWSDGTTAALTIDWAIAQKSGKPSLTVTPKTKTLTAKNLKKKKIATQPFTVKTSDGATVTYAKVKWSKNAKCLSLNKKTGKVTVSKKTKKGTYKIKVKATAKSANLTGSATATKTFTVKVK